MRLILAESNLSDAQLITSRVSHNGSWDIELAQSASECLDLLERGPADLLLLDAELPCDRTESPADAFQLLEQIKQDHPDLPVIMVMPAGAEAELIGTRAMHQLAQWYVTKGPGWESRLPLMVQRWQQGMRAQEQVERTASELSFLRQHYQTLLAYTREAVLALNPAGSIVHFSPTAERLLGYSAEEAVGEHISMLYDPAAAGTVRAILEALAAGQTLGAGGSRLETADGHPASSIQPPAGAEPTGLPATASGRTESLAQLPGILRLIPADSYVRTDASGRTEGAARQGDRKRLPEVIRYEAFLRHSQGHFLIFEVTMAPVRDDSGRLTGYLSFCRELTEDRQAQRELLRTKSLLQTIMDTAPLNVLILGATGNIVTVNRSAEASLGYLRTQASGRTQASAGQLIGERAAELTPEPEKLEQALQYTLESGEHQQFTLKLRDSRGGTLEHQVFTAPMRNSQDEITGVIAITCDLSAHRQEVESLRAELEQVEVDERKARALFDTAASIADTDDLYGVFAKIAQSAVEYLGFDEVTVYRTDHEQGLLVGVVRASREMRAAPQTPASAGQPLLGPRAWAEPQPLSDVQIKLAADEGPLADFALGSETYTLRRAARAGQETGPSVLEAGGAEVLVQMRTPGADGTLVGVISATVGPQTSDLGPPTDDAEGRRAPEEALSTLEAGPDEAGSAITRRPPAVAQQISLLCSMARLASVANERARMERLRNQLISAVSHELRTPLAAIRAYNELMLDGDAGPINEEQRLFLSRIEATSLQLGRILEDLLDLSRMRAGELSIRKTRTDVAAIVQYIINTVQPEAAKRDTTLQSRVQPELPPLVTDPDRLSQVLINLVDNAVKYGREGGSVLVEARVDQDHLVISVADDGPGIPPEDLDKIFDEFHRGKQEAEHRAKGAGLGLAIVSRLTRLLGGSVSVDSTVGEGSTFYLRFPLAHLAADDSESGDS
jgi:PAS domain S-box-containing protein